MTSAQAILASILLVTLVAQAIAPGLRLVVVVTGAGLAALASSLLGVATTATLLAGVPWQVLVMLVALGLLTEALVASRIFAVLGVAVARWSRGEATRALVVFAVAMYAVSGLVNNLTALLLILPVMLALVRLVAPDRRVTASLVGALIVACNLGGAATPIGDFPAILLLGAGRMGFLDYLASALPPTILALALVVLVLRRRLAAQEHEARALTVAQGAAPGDAALAHEVGARLSLAIMGALHRRVRLDLRIALPPLAALGAMLAAWALLPATGAVGPEVIAWVGVSAALLARPSASERLLRTRADLEAALFLLSLFVMVGAVDRSGVFALLSQGIAGLDAPAPVRLVAFILVAGVTTGLVSAGPSMAALLEVAPALAASSSPRAVYVGLALAVCAGSSLFLTAATAGPLAQALVERAQIRGRDGERITFGFFDFLPTGLWSFTTILAVAVGYALAFG